MKRRLYQCNALLSNWLLFTKLEQTVNVIPGNFVAQCIRTILAGHSISDTCYAYIELLIANTTHTRVYSSRRYDTRPRRTLIVQETCNAKTFKQIEFRRCVILKFPPQRIINPLIDFRWWKIEIYTCLQN